MAFNTILTPCHGVSLETSLYCIPISSNDCKNLIPLHVKNTVRTFTCTSLLFKACHGYSFPSQATIIAAWRKRVSMIHNLSKLLNKFQKDLCSTNPVFPTFFPLSVVTKKIRILTRNRGQKRTAGVLIDVERHIKELAAVIGGGIVPFGEPNVRFKSEEGAPGGVVPEKLPAEAAQNPRVETIYVIRRRSKPHLSISEVQNEMLSLITNTGSLEAEEEREPVEEIILRPPRTERRLPQLAD
nr:hypothetical protein CR513_27489 [Ipomoea batatas]